MEKYKKALWTWFVANASTSGQWGYTALDQADRAHLERCGINIDKSWDPTNGEISEWGNTENPYVKRPAIVAEVWECNCGHYGSDYRNRVKHLELAVTDGTSLGDILKAVLEIVEKDES